MTNKVVVWYDAAGLRVHLPSTTNNFSCFFSCSHAMAIGQMSSDIFPCRISQLQFYIKTVEPPIWIIVNELIHWYSKYHSSGHDPIHSLFSHQYCIIKLKRKKTVDSNHLMRVMDWYSWLRRASIDPLGASEYAVLFTQNELEEEDIVEFNHEFLQSMGISIAKHRLNILKLASKERKMKESMSSTIQTAISKVKHCLSRYVHQLLLHHNRSAIVLVPSTSTTAIGKKTWGGAMFKRKKKRLAIFQQERLLLTDGIRSSPSLFPEISTTQRWSIDRAKEEFRWDSMFENLKPT
ncbi:hypothetical protein ZOSMA_10G00330 [Zostera marina]|uniref:SAM domain-containing protein n=1 Tax=Zostera marina TaxID=29655 RepID=A0A0K9Q5M4_ZOSMR|nr:hypothetical protein ZOSMA_10G00330 [Zostera marina]